MNPANWTRKATTHGIYYEFGSIACAHVSAHGEFFLDLLLPGGTITFQDFFVKSVKVTNKPIMRASNDPHRLWLSRNGRKAKS